jgi:AcrR family transcriptional regulator
MVERGKTPADEKLHMTPKAPTRERILDAATDLFGLRGVDAVSLDVIAAEVGVAKQTLLYWFASKDDLVQAVLVQAATQLSVTIEAAIRASGDDPLDRIEAVVRAVFRPAVRRPSLLGLIREISRLSPPLGERVTAALRPLVDRAVVHLQKEMDRGRIRQADPRLIAALCYATVTGIATEPEVLRTVGWEPTTAELRRLRTELLAFLRAALQPGSPAAGHRVEH